MKSTLHLPALAGSCKAGGLVLLLAALTACGSGGKVTPGDEANSGMTGDQPGTGSMAGTGYETAEKPYNSGNESVGEQVYPGGFPQVEAKEAMHGSSTVDPGAQQASVAGNRQQRSPYQLSRQMRMQQLLIGSDPANRSRMGQSLRADNPEKITEYQWGDSPMTQAAGGSKANENEGVPLNASTGTATAAGAETTEAAGQTDGSNAAGTAPGNMPEENNGTKSSDNPR